MLGCFRSNAPQVLSGPQRPGEFAAVFTARRRLERWCNPSGQSEPFHALSDMQEEVIEWAPRLTISP